MTEKEEHILKWIHYVSQKRPELNGFAICPFASKSKYKIIECDVDKIKIIEGYQVIIYIVEDHLNLNDIEKWVNFYNSKYKLWKFFEDCGSYATFIQGIQTNNGKYNLILAQPKQELREFRKKLSNSSYYDLWNDEYLSEILQNDYDIIQNRDRNPVKSSEFTNSGEKK